MQKVLLSLSSFLLLFVEPSPSPSSDSPVVVVSCLQVPDTLLTMVSLAHLITLLWLPGGPMWFHQNVCPTAAKCSQIGLRGRMQEQMLLGRIQIPERRILHLTINEYYGQFRNTTWKILRLERLGSDILPRRFEKNAARLGWNILRLTFCGFGFGCQV